MAALMARFGGHPYEKGDMLRFNVVDPQKSLRTNMSTMGYHEHELVGGWGRGRQQLHPQPCPQQPQQPQQQWSPQQLQHLQQQLLVP
jgi:hypothetical protein